MTLDELAEAWTQLRTRVVGRGLGERPSGVSEALATKVANAAERWQRWYPQASLLDQLAFEATAPEWVRQYRELALEARAAGIQLTIPGMSSLESLVRAGSNVARAVTPASFALAIAAAAFAVPVTVYLLVGNRRRSSR